jgi:hypothetical protein
MVALLFGDGLLPAGGVSLGAKPPWVNNLHHAKLLHKCHASTVQPRAAMPLLVLNPVRCITVTASRHLAGSDGLSLGKVLLLVFVSNLPAGRAG